MIAKWFGRVLAPGYGNGHANGNGNGSPSRAGQAAALRDARGASIGNGASSISPLVDPDDVLSFEVGRARRYERALSIVVVSALSWPDDLEAQKPPFLPLITAAGLREVLRETDIMCYQPTDGHFVLGLTESEGPAAHRALERVQALFKNRLQIDLAVGVAQFPHDGLTLDDLVASARAQAGSTKVIEVVPEDAPAVQAPLTRRPSPHVRELPH